MAEKRYRATFASASQYAGQIDRSRCVLPISVGQHYVEGEKFHALIRLINQHFSSCEIIVIDLLQRHTLCMQRHLDYHGCWTLAIKRGREWLQRNQAAINNLTVPHRVRFWREWLYGVPYLKQRRLTEHLYQTEPSIRQAVDQSANDFVRRYTASHPHLLPHTEQVTEICLQYVLEECSVMPLWVGEGYHYEVYAGKRIAGMVAIYDLLIKPRHPELLRWLRVNLRSVKSMHTDIARVC